MALAVLSEEVLEIAPQYCQRGFLRFGEFGGVASGQVSEFAHPQHYRVEVWRFKIVTSDVVEGARSHVAVDVFLAHDIQDARG